MNSELLDGTTDEKSTKDDGFQVSLACIKPNVVCQGGNEEGYYFTENGKTWWQTSGKSIFRVHDSNFTGMRFEHKRCPFCNRITSIHPLHWLNHLDKCAPSKYSMSDLMRMQHYSVNEYDKISNGFIGR